MDTMSDLDLLASAAREALDAQAAGVLVGPALDEVALGRAARLARRRDMVRRMSTVVAGDAA
jgi:hypothetical protein